MLRVGLVLAIVGLLTTGPAAAQAWCQDWLVNFLDTSSSCETNYSIPRYFGNDVMSWGGSPYLVVNGGNELGMYWILGGSASHASVVDWSFFNIPTRVTPTTT